MEMHHVRMLDNWIHQIIASLVKVLKMKIKMVKGLVVTLTIIVQPIVSIVNHL